MPHKHKRKRAANEASLHDLPPSKTAKPIPIKTKQKSTPVSRQAKPKPSDDTPRAFARLFTTPRPPRSGLDDGSRPNKNRKGDATTSALSQKQESTKSTPDHPQIQHHESLSAFAARVDAMLPFKGMEKKNTGTAKAGLGKERQTKHERKMQKMQQRWREEDQRLKEKAAEERDDESNDDQHYYNENTLKQGRKKSVGGKKRKAGGSLDKEEGDIWASVQAKPSSSSSAPNTEVAKSQNRGLVGLHDVVDAPPQLQKLRDKMTSRQIKVGVTGGLKREGELQAAREAVVEKYREMLKVRRGEEG